jgi:hypothetical protein
VLYQNGVVVDRLDQPTLLPWSSAFAASPGMYDLDVEVLTDFSCLEPAYPHLELIAVTENYETAAFAASMLLAVGIYVGFVLLVFVPIVQVVRSLGHSNGVTDSATVGQDFQWARTLPLSDQFPACRHSDWSVGLFTESWRC